MKHRVSLGSLVAGAMGLVWLSGCQPHSGQSKAEDANSVDLKHPVREADNNDYISVAGTVVNAGDHSFELDYGNGHIVVEMDDHDDYAEGKHLLENDRVIVYGYIDDDFYEKRTIEASSVYVRNLGTQFYASGVDEEDFPAVAYCEFYPGIAFKGEVVSVVGRKFTLDTGVREIKVDTSELPYNPLDEEGYQRLEEGDRVYVTGSLDGNLFEAYEIDAYSIVEVSNPG